MPPRTLIELDIPSLFRILHYSILYNHTSNNSVRGTFTQSSVTMFAFLSFSLYYNYAVLIFLLLQQSLQRIIYIRFIKSDTGVVELFSPSS